MGERKHRGALMNKHSFIYLVLKNGVVILHLCFITDTVLYCIEMSVLSF